MEEPARINHMLAGGGLFLRVLPPSPRGGEDARDQAAVTGPQSQSMLVLQGSTGVSVHTGQSPRPTLSDVLLDPSLALGPSLHHIRL